MYKKRKFLCEMCNLLLYNTTVSDAFFCDYLNIYVSMVMFVVFGSICGLFALWFTFCWFYDYVSARCGVYRDPRSPPYYEQAGLCWIAASFFILLAPFSIIVACVFSVLLILVVVGFFISDRLEQKPVVYGSVGAVESVRIDQDDRPK